MITKANIKKEIIKYKGSLTETEYDSYDQSYSFIIDAPEGMVWNEGYTSVLIVRWYPYDKTDKQEQFKDALNRISFGISKEEN